jgi:Flp pilus assembly protein TadD
LRFWRKSLSAFPALLLATALFEQHKNTEARHELETVRREAGGSDAEALVYLKESAGLKPAEPEPHKRMLAIYTRAGRAELANAEQLKLAQLVKSSKNQH